MKTHKASSTGFAVCVDNSEYPASLELHRVLRLLDEDAAKDGDVRIIDESGEDYLYPADYFVVIKMSRQTARILNSIVRTEHAARRLTRTHANKYCRRPK